jgi:DNA-binding transcriptional ArsR family regulator
VSGVDSVFSALADSTRRSLFEEVSRRGSVTPTELASVSPVSRQAVAKHLGVLSDAGLVSADRVGRETRYRPTPSPFSDAIGWMVSVGGEWDARLAALSAASARRRPTRHAG